LISPQILGGGCVYSPSCSDFSKNCIEEYGFLKGIALSSDRLCRCSTGSIIETPLLKMNNDGLYINPASEYYFRVEK
jgi:hypothetical protein